MRSSCSKVIPAEAVDLVAGYLRRAELRPQVRLQTLRRDVLLHNPRGMLVGDVVDDAVVVLDGDAHTAAPTGFDPVMNPSLAGSSLLGQRKWSVRSRRWPRSVWSWAPWYVIPADRKWFMRIVTACVLIHTLIDIDPRYPTLGDDALRDLGAAKALLESEAPSASGPGRANLRGIPRPTVGR